MLKNVKNHYVGSIAIPKKKYDLIIIDGLWRNACLQVVADYLNQGGLIILDNSDRWYQGVNVLRGKKFIQIDFSGFSPINPYTTTTSLFLSAPSILADIHYQPSPIGGLGERVTDED